MTEPSRCDIESLIPHRAPMRIVEHMLTADDSSIETVSTVRETWPTAENGHASALVLVELIAQSAAALAGWVDRNNGTGNKPGYLVGVPWPRFAGRSFGSARSCIVTRGLPRPSTTTALSTDA
jgi:predicted hotdog family 3-hydroxylacyl-ACP dehydratase